jgi:hypothetical protein
MTLRSAFLLAFTSAAAFAETNPTYTFPIQAKTPEEELKTIQLPDGYSLELVLSDPLIKEPMAIAFDGNGKMYVVEMRTYMQDIDGTGRAHAEEPHLAAREHQGRRRLRQAQHLFGQPAAAPHGAAAG